MDHLNRRDFVRKAGLGAAGTGILTGCGAADTQSAIGDGVVSGPRVQWRMATSFPPSVEILSAAASLVADRVAALTGGRFTIRVFPPGELLPALQVMDGVQSGTVDSEKNSNMRSCSSGYFSKVMALGRAATASSRGRKSPLRNTVCMANRRVERVRACGARRAAACRGYVILFHLSARL